MELLVTIVAFVIVFFEVLVIHRLGVSSQRRQEVKKTLTLIVLAAAVLFGIGCDENNIPTVAPTVTITATPSNGGVHGTVNVDPGPDLPDIDIQFKEMPSPSPSAEGND